MDRLNLMEFNSPTPSVKELDSEAVNNNISPGNNPFDSLSQRVNDLNISTNNNIFVKYLPPECIEDFFNINMQTSERESLAILKELEISIGKESLGILKPESLNVSFNVDNLNVPSICLPPQEDQTTNLSDNPLNTAFLYSVHSRNPSVISNNSYCTNTSFFNSASLEASEPSNIYSSNSFKTFDICSKSEDLLNEAFLTATLNKLIIKSNKLNVEDLIRKRAYSTIEGDTLYIPEDLNKYLSGSKRGCWSVPEFGIEHEGPLEKDSDHPDVQEESEDELFNNSVFIEANFLASKIAEGSILDEDFSVEADLLDSTNAPNFEILNEFENDNGEAKTDMQTVFKAIDKMLPPQKVSLLNLETESSENDNCLNVPITDINKENVSCSLKDCSNSKGNSESKNLFYNNNEGHSQKLTSSQGNSSNGSQKSKNANELLQDLSEIINNENRNPKQKLEGQQLLCSLASILCSDSSKVSSNKLENSEDSGHSSIEQEEQQNEQDLSICYQVLDLRTAVSKSNENAEVLDLSMKSSKRSSQSFSFPSSKQSSAKLLTNMKTGPSIKSSTSLDSKRDQSNNEFNKLKPKRIEQKTNGTKKGPLKAIIPLGNMAKYKSLGNQTQSLDSTPPKIERNASSLFKTKRTSTPISEPPIKPMAQSTPDNKFQPDLDTKPISCSSQLKKRKFYCPISPLAKQSSIGNMSSDSDVNKTNRSGSAPNLSNVSDNSKKNLHRNSLIPSTKQMHRRHSATELKVSNNNYSKLKRSYSIGKDMRPPGSSVPGATSAKGNVTTVSKKQSVLQEKNTGVLSKLKSCSLLGKGRRSSIANANNKENVIR